MVMGTPAFMAPEQALAHWDQVDGRTDLWAVGATMFTLLSGRHVHEGDTGNEQLIRAATAPSPSLGSVVPGLPASLVAIVDRALAFDRELRFADAAAMQQAVQVALEGLGGAEPLAVTLKATEPPPPVVWLTGWTIIAGGPLKVRGA